MEQTDFATGNKRGGKNVDVVIKNLNTNDVGLWGGVGGGGLYYLPLPLRLPLLLLRGSCSNV